MNHALRMLAIEMKILRALYNKKPQSTVNLKRSTGLTSGKLSAGLRSLKEAGLISGGTIRPRYALTKDGVENYLKHVEPEVKLRIKGEPEYRQSELF